MDKLVRHRLGEKRKAASSDKPSTTWDRMMPGLGVRFNSDGTATYVVKYRFNRRQVMKTIGSVDFGTTEQARRLVARMKLLARNGQDPICILDEFLALEGMSKSGAPTFEAFARAYIDRHAREHKKSWRKDEQRIERYLLPAWANYPLNAISTADVAALHANIGRHAPFAANRAVEQLRVMFRLAVLWGFLPQGHPNPAIGHRMYRERSRDRFITSSERPRVMEAIEKYPDAMVRAALKLDFLTGLRVSELLGLRWEWVDFDAGELHIPDTKAGRPHHQPLTNDALEILRSLPHHKDSAFVFPGRSLGSHWSRLDKAWKKIRIEAGIPDVRLHDIRRTVGSIIAQETGSLPLVAAALNQSTLQAANVYSRFCKDHVRSALQAVERKIVAAKDCTYFDEVAK